jgi:putative ABC transport system permease protein
LNILALAIEGLLRKRSRNLLTMSGVVIGVFALTMIISLGEGLNSAVRDTVSGTDNLRQVGISGGFGIELVEDPADVRIEGDMSPERRERLRRAAINRRQIRQWTGRRVTQINDEAIERISRVENVESVAPVILERYEFAVEGFEPGVALSFGVDTERDRFAPRVIAGSYFSGADAQEVILHEFLLYRWGLISDDDYTRVLGKTIRLKSIVAGEGDVSASAPPQIRAFMEGLDDEERQALGRVLPRLLEQFGAYAEQARRPVESELTIVGVLREAEADDIFNVIEDGNTVQVDVFLPKGTARELFLSSLINRELGYPRGLVMVDKPENATKVEQELRDMGFTAFSVAGALERMETMLTVITVIIGFLTGIALIVSTLGIVNTMITSVLERTREIGIFKAVGATNWQVQSVFLLESAMIGLLGGLIGLLIAWGAMYPGDIIARGIIADRAAVPYQGSVFILPLWLAVAGPVLGTATAILAAIVPARRAARIDPVQALRHD